MKQREDDAGDGRRQRPETPLLDFLERLALKLQAIGEWLMGFVR
jgi:hypothetical protein